jgi:RNA polymerase sigma factor (sigma-70 family)
MSMRSAEPTRKAWPKEAVDLLVELYPLLLATARPITDNMRAAEDLVQDALVRTLVSHPDLTELAYPFGYVRTVLWRLSYARRRARWVEVPLELAERSELSAMTVDEHAALVEALARLGQKQRACVALRYLHGFDDDTIAHVLGCRPSTVRSQMARGLAHLRELMEVHDDEGR